MATFNILNTGSLTIGSGGETPEPVIDPSKTRFTVGGNVEEHSITGTLDRQWMIDNGYFDSDEYEWIKYITHVDIGNTVTIIGTSAFAANDSLTSVTIPNSVISIGDGAFGASGMTSVTIPNSVTSIGNFAFQTCSSLTNVTIGDHVTSIGQQAFDGCFNLETITVLGKTTAQAQTLLGNAEVPEECTIVGELGD